MPEIDVFYIFGPQSIKQNPAVCNLRRRGAHIISLYVNIPSAHKPQYIAVLLRTRGLFYGSRFIAKFSKQKYVAEALISAAVLLNQPNIHRIFDSFDTGLFPGYTVQFCVKIALITW